MQHALYSAGESDCCIAILRIEAHSVKTAAMTIIITLCAYAQQGYAFGHVGLCICVYVCIYVAKKNGCLRSYCLNISRWCNLLFAH